MAISAERRAELIKEYGQNENDTGSAQVQVAILTEDIRELTEHLKEHKHDFSTRRGLLQKVSKRNRLSAYLKRSDREAYLDLIKRLGLRK
jgi:small subunit ribosomal protein S15